MRYSSTRGRFLVASILIVLTVSGLLGSALRQVRASASPVWTVSLYVNSVSGLDVTLDASALQSKSFRIGAVINSSSTSPLTGVYAWQFAIEYNSSAFIPQGDPGGSYYPDGAENTVLFGSQATAGSVNWAALLTINRAYGSYNVVPEITKSLAKVYVYFTLLNLGNSLTSPGATIATRALLANVGFELLNKPTTPQSFKITDVKFVDSSAFPISNVTAGASVVETVTNAPPHARLSVTRAGKVGKFAFIFDAYKSSDADDPIPNPGGYFWDFGDGTLDLGLSGPRLIHDFGTNGTFTVTLRVQDSQGATGSVRDVTGGLVRNFQPSHMRRTIPYSTDLPPVAQFGALSPPFQGCCSPGFPLSLVDVPAIGFLEEGGCFYCTPLSGESLVFYGGQSYDSDGVVLAWYWNFGDGTKASDTSSYELHTYSKLGNYSVDLTVVDDANLTASISGIVSVNSPAFTFFPTIPTAGENVSFDGTHLSSSLAPPGYYSCQTQYGTSVCQSQYGVSAWSWDLGDGSSASGPIVQHAYSNSGTFRIEVNYTIWVTVADSLNSYTGSEFQYKVTLYASAMLQVGTGTVDPHQRTDRCRPSTPHDLAYVCVGPHVFGRLDVNSDSPGNLAATNVIS